MNSKLMELYIEWARMRSTSIDPIFLVDRAEPAFFAGAVSMVQLFLEGGESQALEALHIMKEEVSQHQQMG